MNALLPSGAVSDFARSERFHRWRSRKDRLVRWLIATGGIAVIWAVVLIFFYLLWVVLPLFLPAKTSLGESLPMAGWSKTNPIYLSVEEQLEVGLRLADNGESEFFRVADGNVLSNFPLPLTFGGKLVKSVEANEKNGHVAVASSDGQIFIFRHSYDTSFSGGVESRHHDTPQRHQGLRVRRLWDAVRCPFGRRAPP
jgi:phosphate transport system permease protein